MPTLKSGAVGALFISSLAAGCASTPDPAKVCTAEWIKPRTERAVKRIESRTTSAMKPLRKAAKSYAKGKEPNLVQMWALSSSFKKLERELKSGRGIKDLKTVAKTCNDPKIVSDALFMQDQGLPSGMISFLQDLPMYKDVISLESLKR